jgi:hypothetical protein
LKTSPINYIATRGFNIAGEFELPKKRSFFISYSRGDWYKGFNKVKDANDKGEYNKFSTLLIEARTYSLKENSMNGFYHFPYLKLKDKQINADYGFFGADRYKAFIIAIGYGIGLQAISKKNLCMDAKTGLGLGIRSGMTGRNPAYSIYTIDLNIGLFFGYRFK